VDFPVDNADLQRTIDKVDLYVQNSYLSGAGLAQALEAIGTTMDTWAEVAGPPTGAYTGTAGTASRYYAAIIEYPLAIDAPPRPFPYRNVAVMPGAPVAGRGRNGGDRTKRYGRRSVVITVANTPPTLDAADFVALTAPAYSGAVAGATFALLAVDVSGALLYCVASGVAPGATVNDVGPTFGVSPGILPTHAEFCIVPPATATASLTILGIGTFAPGGILSVEVGTITAEYTPVANDTPTTIAAALATEIASVQRLVSATATGPNIRLTALATGPAGNLTVAVTRANATIDISAPPGLAGGTAGGPVYGPRTRVSGPAGV
jgi:hypothetical protein